MPLKCLHVLQEIDDEIANLEEQMDTILGEVDELNTDEVDLNQDRDRGRGRLIRV